MVDQLVLVANGATVAHSTLIAAAPARTAASVVKTGLVSAM